jgi:hypothetical protein
VKLGDDDDVAVQVGHVKRAAPRVVPFVPGAYVKGAQPIVDDVKIVCVKHEQRIAAGLPPDQGAIVFADNGYQPEANAFLARHADVHAAVPVGSLVVKHTEAERSMVERDGCVRVVDEENGPAQCCDGAGDGGGHETQDIRPQVAVARAGSTQFPRYPSNPRLPQAERSDR